MSITELQSSAVALEPGEGEQLWFLGTLLTVKVGGRQSGGSVCVVVQDCPQGFGAPLHVHSREDEWFYVLEGEMTFYVADEVIAARAGSFVYGPSGLPHTFSVDSPGGARFLLVAEPAGFEDFVAELGEPATAPMRPPASVELPSPERLVAVAAEYGIEILGPPPAAGTRD